MNSDPGLSYFLTHLGSVGVSAARPAALWLFLLLVPLWWWRRAGIASTACRTAAFGLVVVALAGVGLNAGVPEEKLALIAVVDLSDSIGPDGRRWSEDYVDRVAAALAPGDELGVVAFAADAAVVRPPAPPAALSPSELAIASPTSATDIAAGLRTALALLPAGVERRLVLISDGNETRGDSRALVAAARRAGAAVYTTAPPHAGAPDVAVAKLVVAPLVSEGSVFPVRIVVRNRTKVVEGTLRLWLDGTSVGEEKLTLQPGLNAVEIPYRIGASGSHRLRAEVNVPGDAVAANNARESSVMVGGKARVLLAAGRPSPALAAVLERKDIEIVTVTPGGFPAEFDDLLGFNCVVFADVAANAFRPGSLDALERYVRDGGGGFVMAAGESTFGDAKFRGTAVERLLPVTLEPRRPAPAQRVPLALFLVIDRSNSMGYHVRNRTERSVDESKLAYAKRAALAVVRQLADNDLVGMIAFDSAPFELAPLRPLRENRARFEQDVPRLQPGGGTDFYDALESAGRQLEASRLRTAHVILLTDGDTNRSAGEHGPLIDRLAKAGVSVTTIRIGDDTVNLKLLHEISDRTGGRFHHVADATALPQLLVQDTGSAVAQAPREAPRFVPRQTAPSPMLAGIDTRTLPLLAGYAASRPRDGADVALHVQTLERRDPLLAAWQLGLGRVVAFTAGPDSDAAAWTRWEGDAKFWSQIVRWAGREQTPRDYAVFAERVAGRPILRVRTFADLDGRTLIARFFADSTKPTDVPLVPRARREFEARLPDVSPGRHAVTILGSGPRGRESPRTTLVDVPAADEEPREEFAAAGPNRALLSSLASQTGGEVDAPIRSVVARKPGTRRLRYALDWLLVPAAMVLLLAGVALRRR